MASTNGEVASAPPDSGKSKDRVQLITDKNNYHSLESSDKSRQSAQGDAADLQLCFILYTCFDLLVVDVC